MLKNYFFYISLALLISLNSLLSIKIDSLRVEEGLSTRLFFRTADVLNGLMAGGFRGIAADFLWIRIDDYSHRGQWYKLLPIFKLVTYLQPKFIMAWSVGGWHMAFNLYHYSRTEMEKKHWLDEGLRFLKEGIANNSERYDLYFEMGWTYYFKAKDYLRAINYLKRAVRLPCPQFVEHVLAHSYEKSGQLEEALKVWDQIKDRPNRTFALDSVVLRQSSRLHSILDEAAKNDTAKAPKSLDS